MTRRLVMLTVVFVFSIGVVAWAQGQAPAAADRQAQQTAPTAGILDKLKDPQQAKQLQQALDVLQQVAQTKADEKPGEHKTVGDVLDKSLDMAQQTVVYLAGKIEQVAPQLWRVLVLQQYVKGAATLINPLGFLLVIWVYRHFLLKWWKPVTKDLDPKEPLVNPETVDNIPLPTHKGARGLFTIVIPLCCVVIGGIWFYSSLTDAAGYFINPNYYALRDIITLVRNPGAF